MNESTSMYSEKCLPVSGLMPSVAGDPRRYDRQRGLLARFGHLFDDLPAVDCHADRLANANVIERRDGVKKADGFKYDGKNNTNRGDDGDE